MAQFERLTIVNGEPVFVPCSAEENEQYTAWINK